MPKRFAQDGVWVRAALWLAAAGLALCPVSGAPAQGGVPDAPAPTRPIRPYVLPNRLPDKPSLPPVFTIPVEPLGFAAPGNIYLGQRNSLVSLDFLNESRLLFTFRVPGLMHRDARENDEGVERQIRAVVLALPAGTVEAEALWTVHDRARYLWMLKDGHFLLRDRDNLEMGDGALELKPFLRFPGPLLWLEMDPAQRFLVADSREPAAAQQKPVEGSAPASHPSDKDTSLHPREQESPVGDPASLGTPGSAAAAMTVDGQNAAGQPDLAVRILRRESGQVMLVSRVRSTVHLPINSNGYLESLRGRGTEWLLNLSYFSGGSTILGRVESACSPLLDFLSEREVLVSACAPSGEDVLVALTTNGRRLWADLSSKTLVWPLLVKSPDGSRLARETLAATHAVNAREFLGEDDIKGQLVQILDAADGRVALEAQASPVLDAGGNVTISPSGRRVAVLNAGAIQIFELPAPPLLPPDAAGSQPAH